jgi:hypothetical protein
MELNELVEKHQHHAEHEQNPYIVPVSITLSIIAVLVAAVTLISHRAHTEELLLQTQATDQWALYQAKNIRLNEDRTVADIIALIPTADKAKAQAALDKYAHEAERYTNDKEAAGDKARELETERGLAGRRGDRLDGGEALLEIGLVICSITLLTRKRAFWFAGTALAVVGVVLAGSSYLIR